MYTHWIKELLIWVLGASLQSQEAEKAELTPQLQKLWGLIQFLLFIIEVTSWGPLDQAWARR